MLMSECHCGGKLIDEEKELKYKALKHVFIPNSVVEKYKGPACTHTHTHAHTDTDRLIHRHIHKCSDTHAHMSTHTHSKFLLPHGLIPKPTKARPLQTRKSVLK